MPSAPQLVPTLRALLDRADLTLRLESDESALAPGSLDVPLRWVHSSDLADPTPFLSEGLVLLTTGTQFIDAGDAECLPYVRRLRTRGVAGLGFGTEVVRDGIPPALVDSCRELQMPLFEVPYRTPFIAVARANAEAIAAEAYSRRSWALSAQRAISLAALRPDGLGASVAELSRELGTWVGLFDSAATLARSHPAQVLTPQTMTALTGEVRAVLRGAGRAASAISLGDTTFTLQTLGRGGHLRGVLAIASGRLDHEARNVITSVVAMVGLALEQNHDLAAARGTLRTGLLQALRSDDPSLARRVARQMWGGLPPAPVVVAMAGTADRSSEAVAAFLEMRAHERAGHVFFGRDDRGLVLCVSAADTNLIEEVAEAFGLGIGVSDPTRYDAFSSAYEQALLARDRGAGTGTVTRFADIARQGVFASASSDDARAVALATLAPLRRSDDEKGTALVETARVWLQNDANGDAAARALGIHRHTVRARIAQMERALGHDLRSFTARAELWAALQFANM